MLSGASLLATPALAPPPGAAAAGEPDRTVPPLAEPTFPPITELDASKATPPPRFQVKAPPGARNVLVVLLDNLGFGATKTFGGVINMPTLERLAKERTGQVGIEFGGSGAGMAHPGAGARGRELPCRPA